MRTSNKILLALLLLIVGTAAAIATAVRVKVDHHWYSEKEGSTDGWTDVPLGPFTQIVIDGYDNITIRQGDHNGLRWNTGDQHIKIKKNKDSTTEMESPYVLGGDSLVLRQSDQKPLPLSGATITVTDLRKLQLIRTNDCTLKGIKGDSLSLLSDENHVQIDSCNFHRLYLDLTGQAGVTFSEGHVEGLWLDAAGDANLSLESAQIGWIKGRWKDKANMNADAQTLQNGITKIEHIP